MEFEVVVDEVVVDEVVDDEIVDGQQGKLQIYLDKYTTLYVNDFFAVWETMFRNELLMWKLAVGTQGTDACGD